MKKALAYNKTLILIMIVLFSMSLSYARGEHEDDSLLPQQFLNIKEATKYNCKIVNLKGPNLKSCVLKKFSDHDNHKLKLGIYDAQANGQFLKSQEICVPSWYQKATVKYLDLLGEGKQFMLLTFEGNAGTGTLQMIQMFIGWHNGKFVPVFTETIDYHLSEGYDDASLKMTYDIKNKASSKIFLNLKYNFTAENYGDPSFTMTASWRDRLEWDNSTYSFYNEDAENDKVWHNTDGFLQFPYTVQRNISKVRLSIKDVDVSNLCVSFFDKTKIMSILREKESNRDGSKVIGTVLLNDKSGKTK